MGKEKIIKWTSVGFALVMGISFMTGCKYKKVDYRVEGETERVHEDDGIGKKGVGQFANASAWQDEWTAVNTKGNEVLLSIDAEILLPEAEQMYVVEVEKPEFDASYKEKVAKQIFGDREIFYNDLAHLPKKELEERRATLLEWMNTAEDEEQEKELAVYDELLETAKDTYTPVTAYDVGEYLGEGSTFTVELELHIQEKAEDDPKFWADHKVAKMIVADDDEKVCLNIVKIMSQAGVVTDYATDGETAVHMMRKHREAGCPYDLILLDWQMPNLNGLETARLIRKNYSDKIHILLLTAYDWSEIENEAIEIGINHFMPKPFFMSTFKDAVRRVMGSQKKEQIRHSDVVRGKKILVVDDIEVNRIILVKILNSLGASCDTASNGQEAVASFENSYPGEYDLILMDVQMPVMNGYAATQAIRGSSHLSAKEIPIIAMTANAFVDDVRDAIEVGMDAHIAKPVQIDKLKSTIQQVLDRRDDQNSDENSLNH